MADVIINATVKTLTPVNIDADLGQVTKVSTSNYEDLYNKPILNGRTIIGDKIGADYNLQDKMEEATTAEIERILYLDL